MANLHNTCMFEGRMTKNITFSQFNGNNGPVDKVVFSISVPRVLTSNQRTAIKNGDTSIKQNDFVQFSLIGAQVNTVKSYFPAGTPIKVVAKYTEYETTDAQSGQKKYGHIFEADSIGFVISPSQNAQDNGNNNAQGNNNQGGYNNNQGYNNAPANNGYNNAPANNGYNNQPRQQQQAQPQQGNYELFPNEQMPF